jgi:Flp pilus assembly protein TadG
MKTSLQISFRRESRQDGKENPQFESGMLKHALELLNSVYSKACERAAGLVRNFSADRAGAVALLFGLLLIPILGFVGGAIDYANTYSHRSKLVNALDAAALTAGRTLDMGMSESEALAAAEKVMDANLGAGFPPYTSNFDIDTTANTVVATANMNVDTYILGVLGFDYFPFGATNSVKLPNGKVEVVMVLDNSGSMGGSKLTSLKEAANNLTDILYDATTIPDYVKIGVVPFAPSVNVGTGNSNALWMDTTGLSSIHFENFDNNVTRWALFNQLDNTSWKGCVEVRPSPHDTDDTAAGSGGGDSYFVPTFAPDEPDSGSSYNNDYLNDDGGSCSGGGETAEESQEKTCKYKDESPSGNGPNYMCTSRAITPLTGTKGTVTSAINNMIASGMTNIMEGVMWGWRILSPGEPFTEGRAYEDDDNRKVMILMTDGANTHTGRSNQNMSRYSAFGYSKHGRLRSPTTSNFQLVTAMNDKTREACTNAKAQNILIYTIAFEITDPDTLALLESCATSPSRAYDIDDGDALIAVFEAIAGEINKLRITS